MTLKVKLLLIGVAILMVSGMALVGCGDSGISQEDYDAVVDERDDALDQVTALETEVADLEADLATCEADVAACEAKMEGLAASLLPDVLTMLDTVDEIVAWNAAMTDTALMGELTTAINGTGNAGLIDSWNAFLAASAAGDPQMTLHQFYGYMLGETSYVASLFPAAVQPLMGVGDEMAALVAGLDIALLGQMTEAVNNSGNAELIQRWTDIISTFQSDLPGAMAAMIDMQIWMLTSIADAAPAST